MNRWWGRLGAGRRVFWFSVAVSFRMLAAVTAIAAVASEHVALFNPLQASKFLALVERDERHALRRAAHLADLRHAGTDEHAAGRYEHDLVVVVHQHGAHQRAVPFGNLNGDHALAAASVAGGLSDRGTLAAARLGRGPAGF